MNFHRKLSTLSLSSLLLLACGGTEDGLSVQDQQLAVNPSDATDHAEVSPTAEVGPAPTKSDQADEPPNDDQPVPCGDFKCEAGSTCCEDCGLCAPRGVSCADLDAYCGPRECAPELCPPLLTDAAWECADGVQGSYTGRCIEDTTDPRVPAMQICKWETAGCAPPSGC